MTDDHPAAPAASLIPTRVEVLSELRVLARIRLGVDRWAVFYPDIPRVGLDALMVQVRNALREVITEEDHG
jgi:hypothetical protein